MTPLEAARVMAETDPFIRVIQDCYGVCDYCRSGPPNHEPDCPWLAMPSIVVALEEGQQAIREAARMAGELKECRVWAGRVLQAFADARNGERGDFCSTDAQSAVQQILWLTDKYEALAAERAEPGREG